jgi:hypothetical protein
VGAWCSGVVVVGSAGTSSAQMPTIPHHSISPRRNGLAARPGRRRYGGAGAVWDVWAPGDAGALREGLLELARGEPGFVHRGEPLDAGEVRCRGSGGGRAGGRAGGRWRLLPRPAVRGIAARGIAFSGRCGSRSWSGGEACGGQPFLVLVCGPRRPHTPGYRHTLFRAHTHTHTRAIGTHCSGHTHHPRALATNCVLGPHTHTRASRHKLF